MKSYGCLLFAAILAPLPAAFFAVAMPKVLWIVPGAVMAFWLVIGSDWCRELGETKNPNDKTTTPTKSLTQLLAILSVITSILAPLLCLLMHKVLWLPPATVVAQLCMLTSAWMLEKTSTGKFDGKEVLAWALLAVCVLAVIFSVGWTFFKFGDSIYTLAKWAIVIGVIVIIGGCVQKLHSRYQAADWAKFARWQMIRLNRDALLLFGFWLAAGSLRARDTALGVFNSYSRDPVDWGFVVPGGSCLMLCTIAYLTAPSMWKDARKRFKTLPEAGSLGCFGFLVLFLAISFAAQNVFVPPQWPSFQRLVIIERQPKDWDIERVRVAVPVDSEMAQKAVRAHKWEGIDYLGDEPVKYPYAMIGYAYSTKWQALKNNVGTGNGRAWNGFTNVGQYGTRAFVEGPKLVMTAVCEQFVATASVWLPCSFVWGFLRIGIASGAWRRQFHTPSKELPELITAELLRLSWIPIVAVVVGCGLLFLG